MSQASKSKVQAAQRHRRQVARLIAVDVEGHTHWPCGPAKLRTNALVTGALFNVHAAREFGQLMVSMADEQAVLEDWTRAQDFGPENRERAAFDGRKPRWMTSNDFVVLSRSEVMPKRGGWPGKLARAYAKIGGKPSAAMGKSIARQGQRLLDAIDGQPSECQACAGLGLTGPGIDIQPGMKIWVAASPGMTICGDDGKPREAKIGEQIRATCPDCRGTGHNLAGVLPPIEWSPALRRRALEHVTYDLHPPAGQESWVLDFADDEVIGSGLHEGLSVGIVWLTHISPEFGQLVHSPYTRVDPRGIGS